MSEVVEEVSKESIQEGDGDSQKQEALHFIDKLKKVVQIFQNKLKTQNAKVTELTKQSELKDKIISAAKENLEKIQKERDQKVQELEDLKLKKGGVSLELFEGQTPEAVLERIQVQNNVWCLVQFPESQSNDSSDEDDEFGNSNTIWLSQDELIEHVNSIGCTLDLPPFSLSSTQASQLRSELASLQQAYDKLEEEYKKYRVDMELLVWNKNSQIDSLKSTSAELPLFASQSSNMAATTANQDSLESLKIQKQAMKEKNMELSRKVDSLNLDLEEYKLTVSDNKRKIDLLKNEVDEWRRKYKEEVKKKQDVVIEKQMSGVTDKETIDSLKQEIDYLRSKNEQMMMLVKKASDSNPVPSPSVPSISPEVDLNGNDILTKNKYLRSLFYNYLCARDKNSRNHMQTALMTIFQFTPEEVMEIRRKASSSWF